MEQQVWAQGVCVGGYCPMHLVTVKVKVDSSLLIKIIVSIKVILALVDRFSLLQNLNIKLPSTYVLRRKVLVCILPWTGFPATPFVRSP
jgi:hypothetical protein